jgi:hypothetical protein
MVELSSQPLFFSSHLVPSSPSPPHFFLIPFLSFPIFSLPNLSSPLLSSPPQWFLEKLGHEGLNNLLLAYPDKSAYAQCVVAYCEGPGCEIKVQRVIERVGEREEWRERQDRWS